MVSPSLTRGNPAPLPGWNYGGSPARNPEFPPLWLNRIEGKPHIVLCKRCRGSPRRHHILQFRKLALVVEIGLVFEPVQQRCHPPRKALRLPYPSQTSRRVALQPSSVSIEITCSQCFGQMMHIGEGQVHALGTGGWHNMRRIAGQEQTAELQRL